MSRTPTEDRAAADAAEISLREILHLSAGTPVPHGFLLNAEFKAIRSRVDELQTIGRVRRDPRASRRLGISVGETDWATRLGPELTRSTLRLDQLRNARPFALVRDGNRSDLRAKVVRDLMRAFRAIPEIRPWMHPGPRPSPSSWPVVKIVAHIPILEIQKVQVTKAVRAGPQGGIPPTYAYRSRMSKQRHPVAILFLDWADQEISIKAPSKTQERDFWFWLRKVSEGVLLAADVLSAVGLLRRAITTVGVEVGGKLAGRAVARGLHRELDAVESVTLRAQRSQGTAARTSTGERALRGEREIKELAGSPVPRSRVVEEVDPRGLPRSPHGRSTRRGADLESPHRSSRAVDRNPTSMEEGLKDPLHRGRSTERPPTGRVTAATRRQEMQQRTKRAEVKLLDRYRVIDQERDAVQVEIKRNLKALQQAETSGAETTALLRRRKHLRDRAFRLRHEASVVGSQIGRLWQSRRVATQEYVEALSRAARERPNFQAALSRFEKHGMDEVFGVPLEGSATVEHLVPRSRIATFEGFDRLDWKDHLDLFDHARNLRVMGDRANYARGNTPYAKWAELESHAARAGVPAGKIVQRRRFLAAEEKAIEEEIKREIRRRLPSL